MKRLPILASSDTCTGCLACIDICSTNAIKKVNKDDGHIYSVVDVERCVGCKKCESVCSLARSEYGNNNIAQTKPFAVWANDSQLRSNSTSGGVFAALAKYIIENGGYVVGATFDGRRCYHKMISKTEEIPLLQGSKYTESDMEGIYRQIASVLPKHSVLFSGLGCQVGAITSFFSKHPFRENLFTIDLVCGGSPSSLLIESYLENNKNVEKIVSFRSKEKYELRIVKNGTITTSSNPNLPLTGFVKELTNRYSCYDCQYTYAHRRSDITIGDLWGDKEFVDEHKNGISLAMCHSDKGLLLLEKSDVTKRSIKWSQFLPYNPRVVMGKKHIYDLRRNLTVNYKKYNYETFKKIYTLDFKPYNIFWFLFKIYHVLIVKNERKKAMNYINRILSNEN